MSSSPWERLRKGDEDVAAPFQIRIGIDSDEGPSACSTNPSGMRSRWKRAKCPASNGVATSSSPFQSHSQGGEDIAAPKPFEERLLEVGVHRHAQFMEQCQ